MTGYGYTAGDVVKNTRARLRTLVDRLSEAQATFPDTEGAAVAGALRAELEAVAVDLEQHLAAIGGDPLFYEDGRAVVSMIDLPDGRCVAYVWDPRPGHETNMPQVAVSVPLGGGTVDVLVVAPGILDVVRRRNDCGGVQ